MDYKLAKELEDAGFPQEGDGGSCIDETCPHQGKPHNGGNCIAYIPTLSELIEACGDDFYSLIKEKREEVTIWCAASAKAYSGKSGYESLATTTPEEAVARLWLALQQAKHLPKEE